MTKPGLARLRGSPFIRNLVGGLLLLVAGGVLGQLVLPHQERLALRRASAEGQYLLLQKVRLFADLGMQLRSYEFVTMTVTPEGRRVAVDTALMDAPVPAIVGDTGLRRNWFDMAQQVERASESVDPRVLAAFKQVKAFVDSIGWPTGAHIRAVERTGWSRPEVLGRWFTLNQVLDARAEAVLALKM